MRRFDRSFDRVVPMPSRWALLALMLAPAMLLPAACVRNADDVEVDDRITWPTQRRDAAGPRCLRPGSLRRETW